MKSSSILEEMAARSEEEKSPDRGNEEAEDNTSSLNDNDKSESGEEQEKDGRSLASSDKRNGPDDNKPDKPDEQNQSTRKLATKKKGPKDQLPGHHVGLPPCARSLPEPCHHDLGVSSWLG